MEHVPCPLRTDVREYPLDRNVWFNTEHGSSANMFVHECSPQNTRNNLQRKRLSSRRFAVAGSNDQRRKLREILGALDGGRRVVVYCQYASELVSRPIR